MGHLSHHRAHRDLQRHLDRCNTGFPDSPHTRRILELLFSEEEAELVSRLPFVPRTATFIARRLHQPEAAVRGRLEALAEKGLIFDLYDRDRERMLYMIAPPVVGFVEFTLMRRRDDIDQRGLAEAVDACFGEGPGQAEVDPMVRSIFGGDTMVGRTLVHREAVAADDVAELLDHEHAKGVIESARRIAVSMCYCRHKAEHLGKPCQKTSRDNCLSLEAGADYVIRYGNGREIDRSEALELLDEARQAQLVHIGDNVKRRLTYICNCCGCCCGQLQAINRAELMGAVKTSNFIAEIDGATCKGCGRCAQACPVQAIAAPRRRWATVDEELCLGCGVCEPACRLGALQMSRRPRRVLTPEGTVERVLAMALERGRLQHLLFDEQDGPKMLLLNRLAGAILALPPVKRALLRDELKSRFVSFLARRAAD